MRFAVSLFFAAMLVVTIETQAEAAAGELQTSVLQTPLVFVQNLGQWPDSVLFRASADGAVIWITRSGAFYQIFSSMPEDDWQGESKSTPGQDGGKAGVPRFATAVVRTHLVGGNPEAAVHGKRPDAISFSYYLGSEPDRWRTDVPGFEQVVLEGVYPGVDLVYHGSGRRVEYDFRVKPGADYRQIRIRYDGVQEMSIGADGALAVETGLGRLHEQAPTSWQYRGGKRRLVESDFVIADSNEITFQLGGEYDPAEEIVIDPVLEFGTYLGGMGRDWPMALALDKDGALWITGYTRSQDFPTWKPPAEEFGGGWADVFVTKYSPQQKRVLLSTYLGGSGHEAGASIAVDRRGDAYVCGGTGSLDFPIQGGYQGELQGGGDAFVVHLSSNGRHLIGSTFLGGSSGDAAQGIGIGPDGDICVGGTTESDDFPTYRALFSDQGEWDSFITKLSPDCGELVFSTYLGGGGRDVLDALAVDGAGAIYATGFTWSGDYPTVNAFQTEGRGYDAFVSKLAPEGDRLMYSTYLGGGAPEGGQALAVDSNGAAYVTGWTYSDDFPMMYPIQPERSGSTWGDGFVVKLAPSGKELTFGTYLGGAQSDQGRGIAVSGEGMVYVVGGTESSDFPVVRPIRTLVQSVDGFVTRLSADGGSIEYSTFLGGMGLEYCNDVAVDNRGGVYVTGHTRSVDFPVNNPIQTEPGDFDMDGWVVKLTDECWERDRRQPGISRLTGLIAYLFCGGPSLPCTGEMDSNGDDRVSAADVAVLVAHLFGDASERDY